METLGDPDPQTIKNSHRKYQNGFNCGMGNLIGGIINFGQPPSETKQRKYMAGIAWEFYMEMFADGMY
jgi:hypothetical protein